MRYRLFSVIINDIREREGGLYTRYDRPFLSLYTFSTPRPIVTFTYTIDVVSFGTEFPF